MTEKDLGGRPPHEPTDEMREQIEKLAKIGCTYTEIAAVVGLSDPTLRKYYSTVIEEGAEKGKASFRRMQLKAAREGNATMLVWLGKTWLKQKETNELILRREDMTEEQVDARLRALIAEITAE